MVNDKTVVTEFLTAAGFEELGHHQFMHPRFGLLFLEEYNPESVFKAIMALGATHRSHQIRALLEIDSNTVFQPSASEYVMESRRTKL